MEQTRNASMRMPTETTDASMANVMATMDDRTDKIFQMINELTHVLVQTRFKDTIDPSRVV